MFDQLLEMVTLYIVIGAIYSVYYSEHNILIEDKGKNIIVHFMFGWLIGLSLYYVVIPCYHIYFLISFISLNIFNYFIKRDIIINRAERLMSFIYLNSINEIKTDLYAKYIQEANTAIYLCRDQGYFDDDLFPERMTTIINKIDSLK